MDGLEQHLKELDEKGISYEILFLDAKSDVLVKRYKETRRQHPLGGIGHVDVGIAKEREKISFLKLRATYILDTSKMLTRELKAELEKIFVEGKDFKNLYVTVMSFGFKYGIPQDADIVLDVRFLPNPYYIEDLKEKNGKRSGSAGLCDEQRASRIVCEKTGRSGAVFASEFIWEGEETKLVIAIGCTGGKHRSVTLANRLYEFVSGNEHYRRADRAS